MSDINQNVNINVNANTQNAGQDIEKLERNIATLDGTINVVGGSVEVLAGALALSGAVSEEQAAKFESMAVGAIAFADGTKRIIEGYRTLATQTKVLTIAQKAYNAVANANPYVLAASAVAALTVAVVAYVSATDKATEAADREREALIKLNEERLNSLSRNIALAKAQGKSIEEIAALRKEELETELELVTAQRVRLQNEGGLSAGVRKNREEIEKTGQRQLEIKNELKILELETAAAIEQREEREKQAAEAAAEANRKAAEEARNARLEYEGLQQTIQNLTDELVDYIVTVDNELDKPLETLEEINEEIEDIIFFTEDQIKRFNEATAINEDQSFEARRKRLEEYYDGLIKEAESNSHQVQQLEQAKNKALLQFDKENIDERTKLQKFFATEQAEAIGKSLEVAANLARVFSENIDESSEEGFEKSKKYKIAETRIASIQAAFSAFGSLVGVPFVGPVLGAAAAAAALASGQKAINDIQASTFEGGGGGLPNNFGSASTPNLGGAAGGPPTVTLTTGQSGVQNLQAVVLAGDVTSAQAQNAIIRNRRRFG